MTIVLATIMALTVLTPESDQARVLVQKIGTIKGRAIFTGNPARHRRLVMDTNADPNCRIKKQKIGSYDVVLNKNQDPPTLRNVLVFVKEGLANHKYPIPKQPATLQQIGCEYVPHVLALREGQSLIISNADPTNHNIDFVGAQVNPRINLAQAGKNLTNEVRLVKEGVFTVRCNVHNWMKCYIAVFDHPFFDVTDKKRGGIFELKDVPTGKYILEAWHETFGVLSANVEVKAGETTIIDFEFEPERRP